MKQNQKGFTLIELLVVIVILGILASIAVMKFRGSDEGAVIASMQSDARNAITAEQLYYSIYRRYAQVSVNALNSSTGQTATLSGSNIQVTASPYNMLYVYLQACQDGSRGFFVRVISSKTNRRVEYNSCTDATLYIK